jgi:hypothetical protein
MGMRTVFPTFSKFIDEKLSSYKIGEFWVGENYHYLNFSKKETHPISVYKLSLSKLKDVIKNIDK